MDKSSPDGTPANRALSAIEAAALLGVSQRTIRRAIANGALPAVKHDGRYQIERTTLDRFAGDATKAPQRPPLRATGSHEPAHFDFGRPHAPLIGRAQELAELCAALSASRSSLITLIGPGGVGKTRLALEAAARVEHVYPDGAHVVSLAPVRDAELVPPAIAQSFGLEGGSSGDAIDRTIKAVRDRRILLVLDNLEQVTAAAPSISRLFHRCPHLTILSTSRAPLRISDEVDYAVSPLPLADPLGTGSFDELISADAVQLFAARAQAVKRDFAVTPDNVAYIAAICQRLDGLPLAIELAATRIRMLSPAALLDRLDPQLSLLTGGPRDRPSHQQTVRDTITWSYDLLDIDDQALFRQLSIFVGGFSLAAAEAVAEMPDVLAGLANLIDQSLVQQTTDALGVPRYTMLETVREYGLELLTATSEGANTRARHAAWMLEYAMLARAAWLGADYAVWNDRLDVERGNVRAALGWAGATGQKELAMRLAVESNRLWRTRGPVSEGVDWLERALGLAGDVPPLLHAEALEVSADLATVAGNIDLALRRADESEVLSRATGDPYRLDVALSTRARVLFLLRDFETAITVLEEALALDAHPACTAVNLCKLGAATHKAGNPGKATELLNAGLSLSLEIDMAYMASTSIMILADALCDLGESARAKELYRDGLRLAIEQRVKRSAAIAISGLAALAAGAGDGKRAACLCGAAAALLDQVGAAMTPGGQDSYDRANHLAREALGDALFEAEWNAGRALSPDAVLLQEQQDHPRRQDGLTRRELGVLGLLAQGRSNREIAGTLFVSERTVANHVASILSKLNLRSRSAAVSYALHHELI
jgi:excisionase family DNA binding protein